MHLLTNREDGLTVIVEFYGGPWNRSRALGETDAKAFGGVRLTDAIGDERVLNATSLKRTYRLDKVEEIGGRLYAHFIAKRSDRPEQTETEPFTTGYDPDLDDDPDDQWWRPAA